MGSDFGLIHTLSIPTKGLELEEALDLVDAPVEHVGQRHARVRRLDSSQLQHALVDDVAEPDLARGRLAERLSQGIRSKLTLVSAPPGFGKSTLVGGWAARVESAWYTVTAEDAGKSEA